MRINFWRRSFAPWKRHLLEAVVYLEESLDTRVSRSATMSRLKEDKCATSVSSNAHPNRSKAT
ncbi:hypothetical protein VCR14J2_620201 [Vibrio coralliirubri]|nr:hypothetical protein VCR14J2_620201 [Vibrio coralliirubri]